MDPKDRKLLEKMSDDWRGAESVEKLQEMTKSLTNFTSEFFQNLSQIREQSDGELLVENKRNLRDVLKINKDKVEMDELMRIFYVDVVLNGCQHYSGKLLGMIPSTGFFVYSVAQHIASLTQKLSVNSYTGQEACDIDKSVLDWVTPMVGYPGESRGVFVSGSSMGVVLALCTARDDRLKSCKDYPNDKPERSVIYMTDQSHLSNHRAINVVGLRECILRTVPKDKYHRMDPNGLEEKITEDKQNGLTPFLVLATMGTTSMGSVDSLQTIGNIALKHKIWYHVDAAYGGFLLLSDKVKEKHKGIRLSDSVTLDCHKGLSAPFGSGIVIFRNGSLLKSSMSLTEAAYIPVVTTEERYEPIEYSFEVTRPFRSFPIWFALKHFGEESVKNNIEEKLMLTDYAYRKLCDMPKVEVFMKPDLTIVAFRYSPSGPAANGPNTNDVTRELLNNISAEGLIYLTPTTVGGIFYIRICVLSFRTHIEEVDLALAVIERNLDRLGKAALSNR